MKTYPPYVHQVLEGSTYADLLEQPREINMRLNHASTMHRPHNVGWQWKGFPWALRERLAAVGWSVSCDIAGNLKVAEGQPVVCVSLIPLHTRYGGERRAAMDAQQAEQVAA